MVRERDRTIEMHIRRILLLVTALALPASAFAAQAQDSIAVDPATLSNSSERRLGDAEIQHILDVAAARREAAEEARINSGPKVFGEVGFTIGTGGYRSAFGSAYVPMGDGFASFSFGTER